MGITNEEHLKFENDELYRYCPLPQCGEGVYKRNLVMTKEIFTECYERWIKGAEDVNAD